MCRLYAFRSTEETKVECTLVHAQNALTARSRRDLAGHSHAHGWGLVAYVDGEPRRERQAWAAYHEASPAPSPAEALRALTANVERWIAETGGDTRIGLNLMLTDGYGFFGTRYGRGLHAVERRGVYDCEICGFPHIHHAPDREHRAVVVASEPLTAERWREIPERSLWQVDAHAALAVEPL